MINPTKKHDYDFLSSIQLVVVDQADALLIQNWDHLDDICKHLDLIPKDQHGCAFERVRNWYLHINAKYFRQRLVPGGFVTPEIMKLFNESMLNAAGKVKTQAEYAGSMIDLGFKFNRKCHLPLLTQQFLLLTTILPTFSRIDPATSADDPEARFELFTKGSATLTLPKHLHKYINLHIKVL